MGSLGRDYLYIQKSHSFACFPPTRGHPKRCRAKYGFGCRSLNSRTSESLPPGCPGLEARKDVYGSIRGGGPSPFRLPATVLVVKAKRSALRIPRSISETERFERMIQKMIPPELDRPLPNFHAFGVKPKRFGSHGDKNHRRRCADQGAPNETTANEQ